MDRFVTELVRMEGSSLYGGPAASPLLAKRSADGGESADLSAPLFSAWR